MGAAYLDVGIEKIIKSRILPGADHELFGDAAPLFNFKSKIVVAFRAGWIPQTLYRDLNLIREIRNKFGHSVDIDLGFDSPYISARVDQLEGPRLYLEAICLFGWYQRSPEERASARSRYEEEILGSRRRRFDHAVINAMFVIMQTVTTGETVAPPPDLTPNDIAQFVDRTTWAEFVGEDGLVF